LDTVLIGVPVLFALIGAVVQYVLSFVAVYIVALIVNLLAPTFSSQRNFESALKLTVYSYTPVWLAGVFKLIPALSFLGILGLYGLCLLYLGLSPLTKTPPEKRIGYTITLVICAILVAIVLVVITAVIGLRSFA
jgi:uncharacterized membrane protein